MLFAAAVYHTQPHYLNTQSNSFGYASNSIAGAILVCLEVVPSDPQFEIGGCGFFCVQKEHING